jgi:hypothetical protein
MLARLDGGKVNNRASTRISGRRLRGQQDQPGQDRSGGRAG